MKEMDQNYVFPGDQEHHTTAYRAWCGCGEWCYLGTGGTPCACCMRSLADAYPCRRCDGTGVEPLEADQ